MGIEYRLHARCAGCIGESYAEHTHAAASKPFAFASSPRHFERDRPFVLQHLALDLALDFDKRAVRGTATFDLERVDPDATHLVLDAVAFSIEKVTLDGKPATYAYDGRRIEITIPPTTTAVKLAIAYSATPRKGIYFLAPDEHVKDRPRQAWTQCQEEDARHFFPCHDKPHVKMTTEARVRVPSGFTVLSN